MEMLSESFLQDFHRAKPSCTSNIFALGKTVRGLSSYEEVLEPLNPTQRILDLACGDGYLLGQMLTKGFRADKIYGLDMSEAELGVAQANPQLKKANLFLGNARQLPFPQDSFDAITCHMAFMLMPEAHEIVTEVARTLKPDGLFVAVTVGTQPETQTFADYFYKRFDFYLNVENKSFFKNKGDQRVSTETGLKSLFNIETGFRDLQIESFEIKFALPPAQLAPFFMDTYDVALLTDRARMQLSDDLIDFLGQHVDAEGRAHHAFMLRRLIARKA